jgi:hypothetical protein
LFTTLALAAISGVLALAFSWDFGVVTFGFFVGWPLAGTLITLDDDFPGGWSNPDGKTRPEWATLIWWIDILLCRGAFVVAAFAVEARADIAASLKLAGLAALMAAIGFWRLIPALRACDRPASTAN